MSKERELLEKLSQCHTLSVSDSYVEIRIPKELILEIETALWEDQQDQEQTLSSRKNPEWTMVDQPVRIYE